MSAHPIYPKLSSLVTGDKLPKELDFIQSGLQNLLKDLYFRNLFISKSTFGSHVTYDVILVAYKKMGVDVPGTDFSLVLNPAYSGSGDVSEIPIIVSYTLPILKYINDFDLSDFSFSNNAFFEMVSDVTQLKDDEFIGKTISNFISSSTPFNDFVDTINSTYALSGSNAIPYPTGTTDGEKASEIATSIRTNADLNTQDIDTRKIVYDNYIDNPSNDEVRNRINDLYRTVIGTEPFKFIKKLITPKIEAKLTLAVGIEFSRKVLIPLSDTVENGGEPLPEPAKSALIFDTGEFTFSSESGIGYDMNIQASLNHPSQIGNTGLTVNFSGARLDLSSTTNIPQATAAGYGDEFKGVFVEEASIGLPHLFQNDPNQPNSGIAIVGKNLLIGTGGFSGTVALEVTGQQDTLYQKIGEFGIGFSAFGATFRQNTITDCSISGALTIPGFTKNNTNDSATVAIQAAFDTHGNFKITADTSQLLDDKNKTRTRYFFPQFGKRFNNSYFYSMAKSNYFQKSQDTIYKSIIYDDRSQLKHKAIQ